MLITDTYYKKRGILYNRKQIILLSQIFWVILKNVTFKSKGLEEGEKGSVEVSVDGFSVATQGSLAVPQCEVMTGRAPECLV